MFVTQIDLNCHYSLKKIARVLLRAEALARLSHRDSVRPSVRLYVCHTDEKLCKLGSPDFHCRFLEDSSFRIPKAFL